MFVLVDYFYLPLVLSLLGSSFIIGSHVLFHRWKRTDHKIIFFLAVSDFLASFWWLLAYFLNTKKHKDVCQLQVCKISLFFLLFSYFFLFFLMEKKATFLEFFFTASWMWPIIFAFHLYFNLVLDRELDNFKIFHIFFIVFVIHS